MWVSGRSDWSEVPASLNYYWSAWPSQGKIRLAYRNKDSQVSSSLQLSQVNNAPSLSTGCPCGCRGETRGQHHWSYCFDSRPQVGRRLSRKYFHRHSGWRNCFRRVASRNLPIFTWLENNFLSKCLHRSLIKRLFHLFCRALACLCFLERRRWIQVNDCEDSLYLNYCLRKLL